MNADIQKESRQEILNWIQIDLKQADKSLPPAKIAGEIYLDILKQTGAEDLFANYKKKSISEALKLYPQLKSMIDQAEDKLDAAIRISALGNILDISNPNQYDLNFEIERLFHQKIQGDSLEIFREKLSEAKFLLVLADNAGETVFDKVLLEALDTPVIYAVKGSPAFDDALIEDAKRVGIDQAAELITSGTPFPGTYLPSCSPEFQKLFQEAPIVLSKGQANFETLSDSSREIFFLLKVKCEAVSKEIKHPVGDLVLKYHSH